MAKAKARRRRASVSTTLAPRPQLVVIRGGGGRGGGGRRRRAVVHVARRGRHGHAALRHDLNMTGLALGGAVVGYAQAAGWLDFLPGSGESKTLAMGAAGYFATRMTKNKYIREAGAAAVAVAAFEFGREHGMSSHPAGPKVHGSFGGAGPFGGV
jgi:hypothetical protein